MSDANTTTIAVGNLIVHLTGASKLLSTLRAWAAPFQHCQVEHGHNYCFSLATTSFTGANRQVTFLQQSVNWQITCATAFSIRLNLESQAGEILVDASAPFDPLSAPLLLALKSLCAVLLVHHGGLLMHAASIRHDHGAGALFLGPSGAGKTTTANMFAEHQVLNDELTAIVFDSHGTRMLGTPFGRIRARHHQPLAAPAALRRGFWLVHAPTWKLAQQSPQAALKSVMQCVVFPHGNETMEQKAFGIAANVVQTATWHFMEFAKDAEVVRPAILSLLEEHKA